MQRNNAFRSIANSARLPICNRGVCPHSRVRLPACCSIYSRPATCDACEVVSFLFFTPHAPRSKDAGLLPDRWRVMERFSCSVSHPTCHASLPAT
jgi:hypothetical protein